MAIKPHFETKYMQRAFALATLGAGHVSPNPLVGCVIVHNNQIIGEGYHKKYGGPHAEVNAYNSVSDTHKKLLPQSDWYVTLEPCSHYGKTPPCAELIAQVGARNVFIATTDPNPLVNGKGIAILNNADIYSAIELGKLENMFTNRFFVNSHTHNRPYIIIKWAQSANGFLYNPKGRWISNPYTRQLSHKWRAETDAIMVANKTVLTDNPSLTTRDYSGRNPIRVVIDPSGVLNNLELKIFDSQARTLIYRQKTDNIAKTELPSNIELTYINLPFIENVFIDLHKKGINSIIVEGGATLINTLIDKGLYDEVRVFVSSKNIDGEHKIVNKPQGQPTIVTIFDNYLVFFKKYFGQPNLF